MTTKENNLVLDNGEKAALTFVLIDWLNEHKEDGDHSVHGEILDIYHKVIAL